jgi:uncharacterized membrane protein YebE (DUF533 family)
MNAIAARRVRGIQFSRTAIPEKDTFDDINAVIAGKLDNARRVAVEEALREAREHHSVFQLVEANRKLTADVTRLKNRLRSAAKALEQYLGADGIKEWLEE